MDESLRDIYNRFGEEHLSFDPRKDELKLLSNISYKYIYYFVILYLISIPQSSRVCRTWCIFLLIGLIVIEVTLGLTDTSLPDWVPFNVTEYEFVEILLNYTPAIFMILKCISEYIFIDIDLQCQLLLHNVYDQQKVSRVRIITF